MKRAAGLLVATGLILAPTTAWAQFYPTCSDATNGTAIAPGVHVFDTSGVAPDGDSCGQSIGVWFKYTAPSKQVLVIDNCGSPDAGTSYTFCFKTTCGGTYWLENSYIYPFPGEWWGFYYPCVYNPEYFVKTVLPINAGETILARIGTSQEVTGSMSLAAYPPAANDSCATATDVGFGTYSFNAETATYDAAEIPSGSCNTGQADMWFKYTPLSSGLSTIKVCGTQLPDHYGLAVTDSCGSGATVLDCGQWYQYEYNGCDSPGLTISVTVGVPVYVRVSGGYDERLLHGTLSISAPLATPLNDNCASATPVGTGSYPFELTAATTDGSASCHPSTNNDVWFDYTAPSSGLVAINAFQDDDVSPITSYGYSLAVFDVNCAGAELACKYSYPYGPVSSIQPLVISVTAGQHLRIRVAGIDSQVGSGKLVIAAPHAAASNDLCTGATPVTEGFVDVDTTYATTDGSASCAAQSNNDVWLKYTPSLTGVSEITNCSSVSTLGRPVLSAYAFSPSTCTGEALACNSAYPCAVASGAYGSRMVVPVTAGVPVMIRVAGTSGSFVTTSLIISYLGPALPNQTCETALPISAGSTSYDTTYAVTTAIPQPCGFSAPTYGGELWYEYTATSTGTVIFRDLDEPDQNSNHDNERRIAVHASCGGAELGCGASPFSSTVSLAMTTGQTAYVRVTDYHDLTISPSNTVGAGTIEIVQQPCAADFNHVNGVTVQDIFDFLTAWLAGSPSANFNGVNGVTVQDIFDFLTAWLAGC